MINFQLVSFKTQSFKTTYSLHIVRGVKSVEKREKKNAGETPIIHHLKNNVFKIYYSVKPNCFCCQLKLILQICLTIQSSGV